jgi:hypothetical protein
MRAALNQASDTPSAAIAARSTASIRWPRRRLANGATNSTVSPSQSHGAFTARPNAPG